MKLVPKQKIPLSKIQFDESNPNKLTDEQQQALAKVIDKYGFAQDIWVNRNKDDTYSIIDGEHRVRYLQEQQAKTAECRVFDLDTTDIKMLRQVANKLRGRHDGKQDAAEFKHILEAGKLDEVADMLAQEKAVFETALKEAYDEFDQREDEPKIELSDDTAIKKGDLIELGQHKILCGDCTVPENYDKLFAGEKASSINTDPPYGVEYGDKMTRFHKRIANYKDTASKYHQYENDGSDMDFADTFEKILTLTPLTEYNMAYIWINSKMFEVVDGLRRAGLNTFNLLVWVKNRPVLSRQDYAPKAEFCIYTWKGKHKFYGKRNVRKPKEINKRQLLNSGGRTPSEHQISTNVLEYDMPSKNDLHPTMKPVEMIRSQIEDSTKKGEIVFDAFLGSGTTVIAAEKSQRICYGMELDPRFVDVIISRWTELTGKAAKINGSVKQKAK